MRIDKLHVTRRRITQTNIAAQKEIGQRGTQAHGIEHEKPFKAEDGTHQDKLLQTTIGKTKGKSPENEEQAMRGFKKQKRHLNELFDVLR
jgi:hypothetical protein